MDAPEQQQPDARAPDAPAPDADLSGPTDVPAVPCTATPDAVYQVAPSPGAAAGTILACAPDTSMTEADVQSRIGSGTTATTAVASYRIAYATRAGDGSPAVSTARVYLPHDPRARPVPVAAVGHGSVGLADSCVPSTDVDNSLPLPFAARGFAAIAPDLAGLGNAGTQDYLDNRAQGWQLLDGARAVRAMLPAGLASAELVLAGYSQGGGEALSAQALVRADGPDNQLVATVAYAPEWPIRLDSFGYEDILKDPTQLTIATGLSRSSIAVLRQYAFFENTIGAGHGVDAFPAAAQSGIAGAITSQCLVALGGYVQVTMLHTGDLIDDTLRTGLVACMTADEANCTGTAQAFYNFMVANVLPPDPHAGPTLIVQGLADQIMAPANEAACIADTLRSASVDLDTCVLPFADHTNIMDNHAVGVAWVESVLAGGPRSECDQTVTLPACQ